MLKEGLMIDTTFNPPSFSSDYTFNIIARSDVIHLIASKSTNLFWGVWVMCKARSQQAYAWRDFLLPHVLFQNGHVRSDKATFVGYFGLDIFNLFKARG